MELTILKIFFPTALAFAIGIALTPVISHYLYTYRAWKPKAGKGTGYGGGATPIFDELHNDTDTATPRLGGMVIWLSVLITTAIVTLIAHSFPASIFAELDYLSRAQTALPLMALCIGAFVGFIDDIAVIKGTGTHFAGGLHLSHRLAVVGATALFIAWWFYEKLEVTSVSVFSWQPLELGIWFIPFFVLVAIAVYASSVIDGIDGLSGGVFLFIFAAYAGIAALQMQYDIAALAATIVGGILAFLWFNIPPARFYMTETGIMALTMTLTVVAFMTDTLGGGEGISVLPVIGFLLVVTVASNVIQVLSKKLRGKKVFLIAPLHHHFEAIGWPREKVAMRYWVLGFMCAVIGVLLAIAL